MKKPERGWKVDTLINVARKETESMKKREYKTDGEEARARLQDLLFEKVPCVIPNRTS